LAKTLSRSTIFCDASHGALRIVAAVLQDQLDLAAVDAAGGIDFLSRHLHAVGNRNAPDLDRAGQVLMGADDDLARRDGLDR